MILRFVFTICVVIDYVTCGVTSNRVNNLSDDIRKYIDERIDDKIKEMKSEIMNDFTCEQKRCAPTSKVDDILDNIETIIFYIRTLQIDVKQLHYGKKILKSNMKHLIKKQVNTVKLFLNKLSDDLFNLTAKVDSLEKVAGVTESTADVASSSTTTAATTQTATTTTTETTPETTTIPTTTTTLKPVKAYDGRVRLVGGGGRHEGRVEVYSKAIGQWGTVCDTNWDDNDAAVICKMIGYTEGGKTAPITSFGEGTGSILYENLACTSSESLLRQCKPKTASSACSHAQDAAVVCELHTEQVEEVRLADGDRGKGRVEIKRGGVWGTVCSGEWDNRDATVVCRMLGFSGGKAKPYSYAEFGKGTGQIWLSNVMCYGDEDTIMHCGHQGWGNINPNLCSHWSDAGVQCY